MTNTKPTEAKARAYAEQMWQQYLAKAEMDKAKKRAITAYLRDIHKWQFNRIAKVIAYTTPGALTLYLRAKEILQERSR